MFGKKPQQSEARPTVETVAPPRRASGETLTVRIVAPARYRERARAMAAAAIAELNGRMADSSFEVV